MNPSATRDARSRAVPVGRAVPRFTHLSLCPCCDLYPAESRAPVAWFERRALAFPLSWQGRHSDRDFRGLIGLRFRCGLDTCRRTFIRRLSPELRRRPFRPTTSVGIATRPMQPGPARGFHPLERCAIVAHHDGFGAPVFSGKRRWMCGTGSLPPQALSEVEGFALSLCRRGCPWGRAWVTRAANNIQQAARATRTTVDTYSRVCHLGVGYFLLDVGCSPQYPTPSKERPMTKETDICG